MSGVRFHGVVDRLLVTEQKVTVVDFKTNRVVPRDPAGCPEGLLRQMGAYAAVLEKIYPMHSIETAILWIIKQLYQDGSKFFPK